MSNRIPTGDLSTNSIPVLEPKHLKQTQIHHI